MHSWIELVDNWCILQLTLCLNWTTLLSHYSCFGFALWLKFASLILFLWDNLYLIQLCIGDLTCHPLMKCKHQFYLLIHSGVWSAVSGSQEALLFWGPMRRRGAVANVILLSGEGWFYEALTAECQTGRAPALGRQGNRICRWSRCSVCISLSTEPRHEQSIRWESDETIRLNAAWADRFTLRHENSKPSVAYTNGLHRLINIL